MSTFSFGNLETKWDYYIHHKNIVQRATGIQPYPIRNPNRLFKDIIIVKKMTKEYQHHISVIYSDIQ